MLTTRKAADRGMTELGWLHSRHTFSFAEYYDPEHMGFRPLRVINDDVVDPGGGFGTHGHRDMEIITVVLEGALAHRDSLGHEEVLRPGEVQCMTAGTGIQHSEYNASQSEPVHFLQIWILPEKKGLPPGYDQKAFAPAEPGNFVRVAAPAGQADGALAIHQDASVYLGRVSGGQGATHRLDAGRAAWVHVIRGSAIVNDTPLEAGDAAAITGESEVRIEGDGELILFDLA